MKFTLKVFFVVICLAPVPLLFADEVKCEGHDQVHALVVSEVPT